MTRRKFVCIAGSAVVLAANLPVAARALASTEPPLASFGGPTPNAQFYVTSSGATPAINIDNWKLRIHGLVNREITLDYNQVRKLPQINETLTLECISNPPDGGAISNAAWVGFKLKPLLDQAGVKPAAVYAAMYGADGYYTGVPLDEIMRSENFMPYMMNGVPLPPDHGYPLRIFIPGKYGMKQPKWINRIEFVDQEFFGYWEQRGWSNSAWRKPNSGFFFPQPPKSLLSYFSLGAPASIAGPVDIVGWALAGPAGIRRVEISTDGGASWHPAAIVDNRSPYIWTIWKYHFAPPAPGSYTIRVRATTGDGVTQPVADPQTGSGMSGQPEMTLNAS